LTEVFAFIGIVVVSAVIVTVFGETLFPRRR
jgi:hypothetical protein